MDPWGITAIGYLLSMLGASSGGSPCLDLAVLDLQRSVAVASASPEAVIDLWADEISAAGDVVMLDLWQTRSFRLESAMLVIGSCTVVSQEEGRVVLDVVDRLGPTAAIDADGQRMMLPLDDWSGRTVVLREVDGQWRYESVTPH